MRVFNCAALASCAVIAFSASAFAADVASIEQPAPTVYDWSGFYIGVHGGYGTGKTDARTTFLDIAGVPYQPSVDNSFDVDGFLGGVQAGFNVQMNQFVFGLEGEYTALDVDGDFNFDTSRPEAIAGGELTSVAAIKGRLGVAFDRTLLFGTAGYAAGWSKGFSNNAWLLAPADDVATGKGTVDGYVIGLGAEHALTDKISVKGEYNYYDFGRGDFNMRSAAFPAGSVLKTEQSIDLHVLKIGINYNF
ncbi:outer membrane protein [Mesorhizobium sp. ANAO-SY3R2]|uniref:outer membrane protein n=1 Tax=Mesorhizobium sp. ANAO-SY3R2 TaxID=3166644 RepID=UPI00366E9296